jgi:hypothetical protein
VPGWVRPGALWLNPADPTAPAFTPLSPAIDTVRFGLVGTSLLLPVYGS